MPSGSRIPQRLLQLASVLTALWLAVSLGCGILLMESTLHLDRVPIGDKGEFARSISSLTQTGVADVTQTAADGAILSAWFVQPDLWNGNSVVLLHGVGDSRQGVTAYAPFLLRAGYAVLLPDSRGHGASGGELATYGLLESNDLRKWADWIAARPSPARTRPQCTYLLGESMGAAIALQAAPDTPHLCAVVAEAPFSSLREIGYERIAQALGFRPRLSHILAWPTVNFAFAYARIRYGLDFNQASPERKLSESRIPALLIAGLYDGNIPPRHSERIAARARANSELWLVPAAGHTQAASVAPAEFQRRVLTWFANHTQPLR